MVGGTFTNVIFFLASLFCTVTSTSQEPSPSYSTVEIAFFSESLAACFQCFFDDASWMGRRLFLREPKMLVKTFTFSMSSSSGHFCLLLFLIIVMEKGPSCIFNHSSTCFDFQQQEALPVLALARSSGCF